MKVLIIGSNRIPSYKIGIEQPLRHLAKSGDCRFSVKNDDEAQIPDLLAADIAIFIRTVSEEAYRFLELAREMGKKTVYVIDDHFLALSPTTDVGRYYNDPGKRNVYIRFLKNADIVKVASDFFAEHLRNHFNPNKIVCFPGSVDFSILSKSEKTEEDEKDGNKDRIVIGYEGGRKQAAFEPVSKALRRIIRKYEDRIRIEFYGFAPEGFENKPHVRVHPYENDYPRFLKRLYDANWDIGLAPLEPTLFHDCKSNNKFREYGACGIVGIYSDSPVYKSWVKNKENGLLAGAAARDWYEAMEELIERPDLRKRLRNNAMRTAKENFTVETCAERWRKQILHG